MRKSLARLLDSNHIQLLRAAKKAKTIKFVSMKSTIPVETTDKLSLIKHLENTPFGIIIFNQKLQISYCSSRAASIFECEIPEMLNGLSPLTDLVYEEDAEKVSNLIATLTNPLE